MGSLPIVLLSVAQPWLTGADFGCRSASSEERRTTFSWSLDHHSIQESTKLLESCSFIIALCSMMSQVKPWGDHSARVGLCFRCNMGRCRGFTHDGFTLLVTAVLVRRLFRLAQRLKASVHAAQQQLQKLDKQAVEIVKAVEDTLPLSQGEG